MEASDCTAPSASRPPPANRRYKQTEEPTEPMAATVNGYLPAELNPTPGFHFPSFFTPDAAFDEGYNLFESSFAAANARLDAGRELEGPPRLDAAFSPFFGLSAKAPSPLGAPNASVNANVNGADAALHLQPAGSRRQGLARARHPPGVAPSAMWNGFPTDEKASNRDHTVHDGSLPPSPPRSSSQRSPAAHVSQTPPSPLHHLLVNTRSVVTPLPHEPISPASSHAGPNSARTRDSMEEAKWEKEEHRQAEVSGKEDTWRASSPRASALRSPTAAAVTPMEPAGPGTKRRRGRPASQPTGATQPRPPKRQRKAGGATAPAPSPPSAGAEPAVAEDDQKRNKFLERNRVAASKCRLKKKEWTSNLETRARVLQQDRNQLSLMASSLKDEVLWLKGELLKHSGCGCDRIRQYLNQEANHLASPLTRLYPTLSSSSSPLFSRPSSRGFLEEEDENKEKDEDDDDEMGSRTSVVGARIGPGSPVRVTTTSVSRGPGRQTKSYSSSSKGVVVGAEDKVATAGTRKS